MTYNPQLENLQEFYREQVRAQSVSFMMTKQTKLNRHKKLIGDFLDKYKLYPLSVLDYGCSDGYLLDYLYGRTMAAARGCSLDNFHGIEPNKGHASWGRMISGLNVTTDTTIPNKQFDLVVLYHVLEHIQQPDKLLAKLHSVLKPGGLLYLALPTIDRLDYPELHDQMHDSLLKDEHINIFTNAGLESFLRLNGFEPAFTDHSLYGYCIIARKVEKKPMEIVNLYEENKQRLVHIREAYKYKTLATQPGRPKQEAFSIAMRGVEEYSDFPMLIVIAAGMLDVTDEQDMLEQWVAKKPHLRELKLHLARTYLKDQVFDKSEALLLQLRETNGDDEAILQALTEVYYHTQEYGKMIETYKVMMKNPYNLGTYEKLGAILTNL